MNIKLELDHFDIDRIDYFDIVETILRHSTFVYIVVLHTYIQYIQPSATYGSDCTEMNFEENYLVMNCGYSGAQVITELVSKLENSYGCCGKIRCSQIYLDTAIKNKYCWLDSRYVASL